MCRITTILLCLIAFWAVGERLSAQVGPARLAHDSLVRLAATYPDDSIARKSWLLHRAGLVIDRDGDHAAAIAATRRALELRLTNEIELPTEVVLSAFNLGTYHSRLGELAAGLEYYDMVLNRSPNRKEGVAYYQIARNYSKMGAFTAGEQAFAAAEQLPPFADDDYLRAILKMELGALHLAKHKPAGGRAAQRPLREALTLLEKEHSEAYPTDYERMQALNLLGWAYTETGEFERALACLQSAERSAREMEIEDEDYTSILANLGLTYRRMNRPEVAAGYYRRALRLERALVSTENYSKDVGATMDNLSTAKLRLGQPDSALYFAQEALRWQLPAYSPSGLTENPALEALNTHRLDALISLRDKARAHRALGDRGATEQYTHALNTYRRADELLDVMRRDQLLEDTRNYWRADAREIYAEALAVAVANGDPVTAFYFMEKARARLLLDEVSSGRARESLPDEVQDRLRAVALVTRRSGHSPAALRRFRQLQDSVFSAFPDYARASVGASPPDPAQLKSIMGDGALVQYFVGEEQAVALVWHPAGGLEFFELPSPARWLPRVHKVVSALKNPYQQFPAAEAASLYATLIAPLKLPAGLPLTIVPDGDLYTLPFGALLTEAPPENSAFHSWPWLAASRTLSYAFSVQLLEMARQHSGRGNGRALALAPVARLSAGAPSLPPESRPDPGLELPATLRTVRHLAGILPTDTLINEAANPAAFRARADAYSLLHLGTHAYPQTEREGGFLLRDSTTLLYNFTDLAQHDFAADLVVIAACETGLGEQLVGEGVASLGRAFARRGAPGLLLSLWSIDDATTAELLNATYDGIAAQQGPATALATAGARYRADVTNPTFGHPYYWAGLVAYGPDLPLTSLTTHAPASWIWVLAVLGLIGVLIILYRRRMG